MSSSEQPEPGAGAVPDAPDNMADAETLLREMLHTIAREHNYQHEQLDIKAITSGGANYTSVLFLATISSPGLPDLKLFAKVACVGEKFREKFNAALLFRNEQIFYNTLIKTWDRFQEKYQIPEQHRFVVPKFYGGKSEIGSETVVMENLMATGYCNYDRFRSVDWELASKSIEEMAKFHALSYVHAKEDPEEFEELLELMKFDMTVDGDDAVMKDMWGLMLDRATGVLTEDGRERIKKYFDSIDPMDVFEFFRRPTHAPILAHGDFRPSNMLYKKQDGIIKPIVLDFQTLHSGSPVSDLMYFIFLGTDEQFRKEHYHQLLEHYYLQLGLALARYQVDVADVYPREDFDDDLKKLIYYAITLGVSVLPVVTVEAENAPKMDDGALESLDTFVVPSNELYSQRFNGIVNDLVRWGVI